jgi:hypothetical protein
MANEDSFPPAIARNIRLSIREIVSDAERRHIAAKEEPNAPISALTPG